MYNTYRCSLSIELQQLLRPKIRCVILPRHATLPLEKWRRNEDIARFVAMLECGCHLCLGQAFQEQNPGEFKIKCSHYQSEAD